MIGFEVGAQIDRPSTSWGYFKPVEDVYYGFVVIKDIEGLVKRSVKASETFSELHGASRVFVLDPEKKSLIVI